MQLHRPASGVRLETAAPPARALSPSPGRTTMWPISPAEPRPSQRLPLRMMPPPTPVPQKTPSRSWYGSPAPSSNSASVATSTSFPTARARRAPSRASRHGEGAIQPGRLPRRPTVPAFGRSRRESRRRCRARLEVRPRQRSPPRASRRPDARPPRRAAVDRRRRARLSAHLVVRVDDDRLDLRPEVDSATQRRRVLHAAERYRRTHYAPAVHDLDPRRPDLRASRRPTRDEYFMLLAVATRQRAECLGRHVGAVLVLDGRIIATGYNGTPARLSAMQRRRARVPPLRRARQLPAGNRLRRLHLRARRAERAACRRRASATFRSAGLLHDAAALLRRASRSCGRPASRRCAT